MGKIKKVKLGSSLQKVTKKKVSKKKVVKKVSDKNEIKLKNTIHEVTKIGKMHELTSELGKISKLFDKTVQSIAEKYNTIIKHEIIFKVEKNK